jgi:hypothetical protein
LHCFSCCFWNSKQFPTSRRSPNFRRLFYSIAYVVRSFVGYLPRSPLPRAPLPQPRQARVRLPKHVIFCFILKQYIRFESIYFAR